MRNSSGTATKIIVYSHGFGVRQDARGLFTDIAEALPGWRHELFDYNTFDAEMQELTVTPLQKQADILAEQVQRLRTEVPDCQITVIAHSLGCLTLALAWLDGIAQAVLLTPTMEVNFKKTVKAFGNRPDTVINRQGISRLQRADGTTTLVGKDYWDELPGIKPADLYKALGKRTKLDVIFATADDPSLIESWPKAVKATITQLSADHNFSRASDRAGLIQKLKEILHHG